MQAGYSTFVKETNTVLPQTNLTQFLATSIYIHENMPPTTTVGELAFICSLFTVASCFIPVRFFPTSQIYTERLLLPLNAFENNDLGNLPVYDGPLSTVTAMQAGCSIENIGLTIFIGPSETMKMEGMSGCGLYLALNEDVSDVSLPSGTVLCGYSKGEFKEIAQGDKCVAYAFCSVNILIALNKKLISLNEAIDSLVAAQNEPFDINHVVYGHLVDRSNEVGGQYKIAPDPDFNEDRYFIPHLEQENGIINMGMMANDLAYRSNVINEEEYLAISQRKNIVTLAWRMEIVNNKMLVPTWPVGWNNALIMIILFI